MFKIPDEPMRNNISVRIGLSSLIKINVYNFIICNNIVATEKCCAAVNQLCVTPGALSVGSLERGADARGVIVFELRKFALFLFWARHACCVLMPARCAFGE